MRILVVDDHPLVRWGVREALIDEPGMEVVGESGDRLTCLELLRQLDPEVLILDLEMPDCDPETMLEEALALQPGLKILALSAYLNEKFLRAHRHRLAGYLLKTEAVAHLLYAMRALAAEETWFSQAVAARLVALREQEQMHLLGQLTAREELVFELLCDGKDNAAIAEQLQVSPQTVRQHTSMVYQKIGVKSRVEAVLRGQKYFGRRR